MHEVHGPLGDPKYTDNAITGLIALGGIAVSITIILAPVGVCILAWALNRFLKRQKYDRVQRGEYSG